MNNAKAEGSWEKGWNGHETAQLRRFSRLTLPQKLEWLEQAQQLAVHLATSRRKLQPPR